MTDAIAGVFLTSSADANEYLTPDAFAANKIDLIGHILIDLFVVAKNNIEALAIREKLGLEFGKNKSGTLYGPHSVDAKKRRRAC